MHVYRARGTDAGVSPDLLGELFAAPQLAWGGGEGGEELELFRRNSSEAPGWAVKFFVSSCRSPASIILPRPPVSLRFRFAFMRAISSFMPKGFVT